VRKVQDLFAVPPKDFTAARNALAKELRDGGEAEEAKRVAALRRPTAAVWAANQLARRAPDAVRALLDAADEVRRWQARAVRGGGGDELRAAMAAQRSALVKLEQEAAAALREAELSPSPSTLRAIQSTVQAAATGDRDARERLRSGAIEHELAPAGFEALLGAAPAPRRDERPQPHREPRAAPRREQPASDAAARRAGKRERKLEEQERKRAERARREEERKREREERRKAKEIATAEASLRRLEERAQAAERAARAAREEAEAAKARLEALRS
jgi:hypothetical protein